MLQHLPRAPGLAGHLSQRPVPRPHEVEEDRVDLLQTLHFTLSTRFSRLIAHGSLRLLPDLDV